MGSVRLPTRFIIIMAINLRVSVRESNEMERLPLSMCCTILWGWGWVGEGPGLFEKKKLRWPVVIMPLCGRLGSQLFCPDGRYPQTGAQTSTSVVRRFATAVTRGKPGHVLLTEESLLSALPEPLRCPLRISPVFWTAS